MQNVEKIKGAGRGKVCKLLYGLQEEILSKKKEG
jgi:hypothetical protein